MAAIFTTQKSRLQRKRIITRGCARKFEFQINIPNGSSRIEVEIGISGALHLAVFEQPEQQVFFSNLLKCGRVG